MMFIITISILVILMACASALAGMILVKMWYDLPGRKMNKFERKLDKVLTCIVWDDDYID